MLTLSTRPAVLVAALLVASILPGPAPAQSSDGAETQSVLVLEPCDLTIPGFPLKAAAECGFFEVAENPDDPTGRRILLNVARVPATDRSPEPDPFFLFAGGPGQAATESWLQISQRFRKLNENRDVILIDQRGTGKSNPLKCPPQEDQESLELDWDVVRRYMQDCLASLDADPRFYTTTIGMQDYDLVRRALGYEKINLFGVSYGTRAAQVYLRNHGESVRTVVLDSVVPQTLPLGTEHALRLDEAVVSVLEACDTDSTCHGAFPGTPELLRRLMSDLDENPREVTVAHPLTGQPTPLKFDREVLGSSLRFLTYSSDTQAMLPLLIHEAATEGNLDRLAAMVLMTSSEMQQMIATGMETSVMCTEDWPLFPRIDLDAPEPEGSLMGNLMLKLMAVRCEVWPAGQRPAGFHDPVESDKPVLLLSGELDPVTPPVYADEVARHLPNSLHLIGPGQGHGLFARGCANKVITDFVNAGSLDGLEAECIGDLRYSPFFVSLTGPRP